MNIRNWLMCALIAMTISAASAQQIITPSANEKWGTLIQAIEQVESRGRTDLVSRNGMFVGCLQISQILVRQCNLIAGKQLFTYADRLNRRKSHEMFVLFQEHFNPDGDVEYAIRLWNSGDLNCMQHKQRTETYYQRVMHQMELRAQQLFII